MGSQIGVSLTNQEKGIIVAGLKTLFSSVPRESQEALYYADVYARITELEELDAVGLDFVSKFTDKILERTNKLMNDAINTEEARLRASVVNDIYVGIKEKINVKRD